MDPNVMLASGWMMTSQLLLTSVNWFHPPTVVIELAGEQSKDENDDPVVEENVKSTVVEAPENVDLDPEHDNTGIAEVPRYLTRKSGFRTESWTRMLTTPNEDE